MQYLIALNTYFDVHLMLVPPSDSLWQNYVFYYYGKNLITVTQPPCSCRARKIVF